MTARILSGKEIAEAIKSEVARKNVFIRVILVLIREQALQASDADACVNAFCLRTAFVNPALGTLGNLGRNALIGPGNWAFDMSLSRIFPLTERYGLEVRADAFNLTNSFRPGNPNVTLTSGQFGQIRTTATGDFGAPRIMQFSMKLTF